MSFSEHFFIDDALLFEKHPNSLNLFICFGKNFLQYAFIHQNTKKIYVLKSIITSDKNIGDTELDEIKAHPLFTFVHQIHIAIDQIKNTLVPFTTYSKNHKSLYFQYIHEIEKEETIYVQIIQKNIVELFAVKKSSINYLNKTFPKNRVYSVSSCLLEHYFQLNKSINDQIFICTTQNILYLSLFVQKELIYHFSFEISHPNDVLYHLLNLIQSKHIDTHTCNISLLGFATFQNQLVELLHQHFEIQTKYHESNDKRFVDDDLFPMPILFHFYSLIVCAS